MCDFRCSNFYSSCFICSLSSEYGQYFGTPMADHSYLLCKVLGWKSNSRNSWASVSHAQEVLNIDVSWKKPSLQIEPIWAPHDCEGRKRIFSPGELFRAGCCCGLWGMKAQLMPGLFRCCQGGWQDPGHWAPPWTQPGARQVRGLCSAGPRAGLCGVGARTCQGYEAGKGCKTPVKSCEKASPVWAGSCGPQRWRS